MSAGTNHELSGKDVSAKARVGLKTRETGTIGKALQVMDIVAAFEMPVRFADILSRSSLPKGTLYRTVQNLVAEGMLCHDEQLQTYRMGPRLLRLAHSAWAQYSLARVAAPVMDELGAAVTETIHLAQLDSAHVLYVDKRMARQPVHMFSQTGKIGPAYCTGVGKAMLAWLPDIERQQALACQSFYRFTKQTLTTQDALQRELERIRVRGYALDRQEHESGIICVAVAILGPGRHLIGGLSVTGSVERTSLEALKTHVPVLQQAAEEIADAASLWQFPVRQAAE